MSQKVFEAYLRNELIKEYLRRSKKIRKADCNLFLNFEMSFIFSLFFAVEVLNKNREHVKYPSYIAGASLEDLQPGWHFRDGQGQRSCRTRKRNSLPHASFALFNRAFLLQEPFLDSENAVFQYSSHVNLQAPSGHMW